MHLGREGGGEGGREREGGGREGEERGREEGGEGWRQGGREPGRVRTYICKPFLPRKGCVHVLV